MDRDSQIAALSAIESRLGLIDELNAELSALMEQYDAAKKELSTVRTSYDQAQVRCPPPRSLGMQG